MWSCETEPHQGGQGADIRPGVGMEMHFYKGLELRKMPWGLDSKLNTGQQPRKAIKIRRQISIIFCKVTSILLTSLRRAVWVMS